MTKRARATQRAMLSAMRVKCDKESDGFGCKSNGNKGGRRFRATRAITTVMATTWVRVMVTRLVRATKRARARVAKAIATVMRVVGNEEGNGYGVKSNGNGNKGGGRATVTATKRVM